ncbi:MAG: uroporphyrinogen decarboxylase family protein [Candidatus Latescibacterota bacterium]
MNSRERYVRALTFDGPDRVPVMHCTLRGAWLTHGRALEELYARYPSDVLLSSRTRGPFAFAGSERGRWADGAVTWDDWGCGWLWNTAEYMGQAVHHPLADWAALERYRAPDPLTGVAGVAQMVAEVDADGHQHFVLADGGEVFQRMLFLRGMENLLVDLYEDRPEVYVLRDLVLEVCLKRIACWLATGKVDGILLRDDWGTQQALMVSPEIWRRVYRPAYERLVCRIHEGGAFVSFHSDGMIRQIVPDLVEIGCDEINPQVQVMDLEELGRSFGGKVCVRADVDRQFALPYGTPDDVRRLVERLFRAFGTHGGGYVGWGEMSSDVPLANGRALLEALYALRYA